MSKVITQLKQLQADAHALFIKLHNYHWNVEGMDFHPVHFQTEEIYTTMSTLYDDAAERVMQLGEKPHLTMGQLVKDTNIKEETKDTFRSKYVVESIIKDFKYLCKAFVKLSDAAENMNDKTTAAFADDNVAILEKQIWMLGAMVK